MKNILVVFGTRPEAIKMCPVIRTLKMSEKFLVDVCSTGQHREMLQEVLQIFNVNVDFDLHIMKPNQSLAYITSSIVDGIDSLLKRKRYDCVLVHGDTTTAYAAALAAFYNNVSIGHVEAGLRTYDLSSPFPEEFNRRSIDLMSDVLFAPTQMAKKNLLKEGMLEEKIFVTGNTAIDALRYTVSDNYYNEELEWCKGSRLILLTAHRRENIGDPMRRIFSAVRRICDEYGDVKIIYPMHMNPKVREIANDEFKGYENVRLIDPLNVIDFHNFISQCYFILTDSGGIQEEAPALDKPVLVLRSTTERPEGVIAGTLKLVGTGADQIYHNVKLLLDDNVEYKKMCDANNPYGDGHAAERIASVLSK